MNDYRTDTSATGYNKLQTNARGNDHQCDAGRTAASPFHLCRHFNREVEWESTESDCSIGFRP